MLGEEEGGGVVMHGEVCRIVSIGNDEEPVITQVILCTCLAAAAGCFVFVSVILCPPDAQHAKHTMLAFA